MTTHNGRFATVALVLLLAGCAHRLATSQQLGSDDKPADARLSKTEAIEIAKRTAERFGRLTINDLKEGHTKFHPRQQWNKS